MTILSKDGDRVATCTVAICVPCGDRVSAGFAFDLAKLIGYTVAARPDIRVLAIMNKGTIIPEQRHLLVRKALDGEPAPTHLLWIDSDMRFPKDALIRLLAHNEKVVAANYATRRFPVIPTASTGPGDTLLFPSDDAPPLIAAARCGMGLMLCDAQVFRDVAAPWFALGFNREEDGYAGEDVFFCGAMHRHGIATLIDTALSREVAHCGEFEFGLVHAQITHAKQLEEERAARAEAVADQQATNGTE